MLLAIYVASTRQRHRRMFRVDTALPLSGDQFHHLGIEVGVIGVVDRDTLRQSSPNVVDRSESPLLVGFAHPQSGSSTMRRRSPSR